MQNVPHTLLNGQGRLEDPPSFEQATGLSPDEPSLFAIRNERVTPITHSFSTITSGAFPLFPAFSGVAERVHPEDSLRLPNYHQNPLARFHPYIRFTPLVDKEEHEILFNTIYDDGMVELDVPLPVQPQAAQAVRPTDEGELERAIEFERRVQRLSAVMLEFVLGVKRALRG